MNIKLDDLQTMVRELTETYFGTSSAQSGLSSTAFNKVGPEGESQGGDIPLVYRSKSVLCCLHSSMTDGETQYWKKQPSLQLMLLSMVMMLNKKDARQECMKKLFKKKLRILLMKMN